MLVRIVWQHLKNNNNKQFLVFKECLFLYSDIRYFNLTFFLSFASNNIKMNFNAELKHNRSPTVFRHNVFWNEHRKQKLSIRLLMFYLSEAFILLYDYKLKYGDFLPQWWNYNMFRSSHQNMIGDDDCNNKTQKKHLHLNSKLWLGQKSGSICLLMASLKHTLASAAKSTRHPEINPSCIFNLLVL